MLEASLSQFFSQWRRVVLGGNRVVLEGLVNSDPDAEPPPRLRRALMQWPGHYYWQRRSDGRWLVLVREFVAARERWWLHALLLVATLLTASLGGAALLPAGSSEGATLAGGATLAAGAAGAELGGTLMVRLMRGLPFSIPLLAILGAHEAGHYLAARRYRINASPPYFLPFVPELNVIGTLGAFIRLRSPVYDRQTLFDISVAGPLAGLAIAVPVLALGLAHSQITPDVAGTPLAHQFVVVGGLPPWRLGDSLLLLLLRSMLAPQGVLQLHPVAVAGWVGVLVTMLHLLPLTQFDGGHALFALIGRRQRVVAWAFWVVLVAMGIALWPAWLVWAALALVVGRGSLAHPRIVTAGVPLDPRRRLVGWLLFALFALCFVPLPVA
ncbi:MAG TPA: site-2 protease family protein [Gemmatimonadaceae bacterium]|nr:site-2 protease family protein [Gemmatimonadaceae bacterium]